LSDYLSKLEETSSRNDMIKILSDLFKESSTDEIDKVAYFLTGSIAAGYKDVQLGIGESMAKSSIALASDVDEDEVEDMMKNLGDLGDVAYKLGGEKDSLYPEFFKVEGDLTVDKVHEGLMRVAEASGESSQETKVKTLASIVAAADSESRRYIVRLSVQQMRLGVGDMTILDGLADSFLGSKDERPPLEHAYNVCSDLGYVAKILSKSGLDGVKRIRIALNRPLKPMLAQRVDKMSDILEKIDSDEISVEEKYDGERVQAHKDGDKVRLYSRRLNEITQQFPEIVKSVARHVEAETVILDGEAVAYDFEKENYMSFQKVMSRRRKYDVDEFMSKVPVKYMVFDIIYRNGSSMMRKSYPERLENLKEVLKGDKHMSSTGRIKTSKLEDLDDFFQNCIDRGLEGVVCKSLANDSYYRAGAREWSWIKWKPSYGSELADTVDLVVVGAYAGRGKRSGTYGALLCASYNHEKDVYQTVCKLGAGFKDEDLQNLPDKLKDARTNDKPVRLEVTKQVEPDYWFQPVYVLEVKASEITESPVHTCNWDKDKGRGLALRFPRFERWRPEKSAEDATTVEEIVEMSK
jgi:DNA ligase-1